MLSRCCGQRASIRRRAVLAHDTVDEAGAAARRDRPCVVKAQVPTGQARQGRRHQAGRVRRTRPRPRSRKHSRHDASASIASRRCWSRSRSPIAARDVCGRAQRSRHQRARCCCSRPKGGMDIEEIAASASSARAAAAAGRHPQRLLDAKVLERAAANPLASTAPRSSTLLLRLYSVYAASDAELVEINPLVARRGRPARSRSIASCAMDDSAVPRRAELARSGTPDKLTELEARARRSASKFIELDGSVGVLANGAGLTMTTMDAVRHFGGESGRTSWRSAERATHKAKPALELVLVQPARQVPARQFLRRVCPHRS